MDRRFLHQLWRIAHGKKRSARRPRSCEHHGPMTCIRIMMVLAIFSAGTIAAASADEQAEVPAVRTGKERLSDKASDEQRVDDCKVPLARRTRARPTTCSFR